MNICLFHKIDIESMKEDKTLVSIIIPIYNARNCLERCINSVLNQKYDTIEVILINDGSTDNSGIICDMYALKDKRVKVIHKTNGGVSNARNVGLEMASGEHITFVDADDYLDSTYVSDMMLYAGFDFVASHIKVEGWAEYCDVPLKDQQWTGTNVQCFITSHLHRLNFMACKLFRKYIIKRNDIKFDEQISYGEDTLFVCQYLKHIATAATISRPSYHYDTIMSPPKKLMLADAIYVIDKVSMAIDELEDNFGCYCNYARNIIVNNYMSANLRSLSTLLSVREIYAHLKMLSEDQYIAMHINNKNNTFRKGSKRLVFDYCLSNKLYLLASIMILVQRLFK